MSEREYDPFRPPSAPLETVPEGAGTLFFTASPVKFVAMSLATFSLYCLWWFYRNFRAIRDRGHASIMPFWRMIFSVIWSYSCFSAIAVAAQRKRPKAGAAGLALFYGFFSLVTNLPDPWWLLSLATLVPVAWGNAWAREANRRIDPDFVENASFSAANWIGIVVGGAIGALAIFATLHSPEPP